MEFLTYKCKASRYTRKCYSIFAHKKRTDILENYKRSTALLPNCNQIWPQKNAENTDENFSRAYVN
jgi:hypothetical protein